MALRTTGKIIRFDDVRGYGFISPDIGGEDVFLHVNDLEIEKSQARPGARVSFSIDEGDRGKFATMVRLAEGLPAPDAGGHLDDVIPGNDEYFDVLSLTEFHHAVTEMLLAISNPLTGDQILQARSGFEQLARKYSWIEF